MRIVTWARAGAAIVVRPRLWRVAMRQARALARPAWWRRPPFLPLPDRAWLRFRMQTAYGDASAAPRPADLVAFLEWCRSYPAPPH
jgi:hypothetical protein